MGISYAGHPYFGENNSVTGQIAKFLDWISKNDVKLQSQIQTEIVKFQENPILALKQLAEGSNLREFGDLLKEKDPTQQWKKLRKVSSKSGFYWLCEKHEKEFLE